MENSQQRGTPSADFPDHGPEAKLRRWLKHPNSHSPNDLTEFREQLLDTTRYPGKQFEAAKSIENELRILQTDKVSKEEYLPLSEKLQDRLEKEAADGKISDEIYRIAMTHLGALNEKIKDPRRFEQDRSSRLPSPEESSTREITEQQDWGHDAQPRSRQGTPEINVSQATDVEAGNESESDPNHFSREQSRVDEMSGREVANQHTYLPSDWDLNNTATGVAENELGRRLSEQHRSLQALSPSEVMSSPSSSIRETTEQEDWGHDAQPRSRQGTPEINVSQATDVEAGNVSESDPNHFSREQSRVDEMSGREVDTNHQTDLPSDWDLNNTATGVAENELGPRHSGQDRSDSNHIDESSTASNLLKRPSSTEPTPRDTKRPMRGERDRSRSR